MCASAMEVNFRQSEFRLSDLSRQLDSYLIDITNYLRDIRQVAQFHNTCSDWLHSLSLSFS